MGVPTLGALVKNQIQITAIANHMELDMPRMIYIHTWATGEARELAKRLKPALDAPASLPQSHHVH